MKGASAKEAQVALAIMLVVWAVLAGLVGLLRGVRASLVAVAGTLLAAVLIDLWAEPIGDWVRATFRPELPGLPTFAVVAAAFLCAAGLLGYGGSALLPAAPAAAGRGQAVDRLLGALLGAVNGALVAGYLLRYAREIWGDDSVEGLVEGSFAASLLVSWLPWYVLAIMGATGVLVLVRLGRAMAARSAAARAAQASQGTAGGSVAAAPSLAEADKRLNSRIDEALGKK